MSQIMATPNQTKVSKISKVSKICSKCKEEKPLTDFAKNNTNRKYGRRSACKNCTSFVFRLTNKQSWHIGLGNIKYTLLKKCTDCKQEKEIFDFPRNGDHRHRSPKCKSCSNAIVQKNKSSIRRRLKLLDLLDNRQCRVCGERDFRKLQIDHINNDGYKDRARHQNNLHVSNYLKHPDEAKEKLQVLCGSCHRLKTYQQQTARGEY